MFATPAYAQAAGATASNDGFMQGLLGIAPFIAIGLLFYLFILRPQQQRQRDHLAKVKSVKRGDTIVLSSGMVGKVVRVEELEVGVEVAQGITVKVVKDMIHVVRTRGEPAPANDTASRARAKSK